MDSGLDPALQIELQRRLDHLALNPRENDVSHEAHLAREQYAALIQYVQSPRGAAKLERDRRKELEAYTQSPAKRFATGLARVFTRGPRVDPEKPDPILRAQLDADRRSDYHVRFLNQLLASSPSPDVVWDADAIGRSVSALGTDANGDPKVQQLISDVCARSTDGELRLTCLRALQHESASASAPVAAFGVATGQ